MKNLADLIRPWWPSGEIGHLYTDCPELLTWGPAPREGAGWLDVKKSPTCEACVRRFDRTLARLLFGWNAECSTCGWSAWDPESAEGPPTQAEAEAWMDAHRCPREITLIAPQPQPKPGHRLQLPLFDLPAVKDTA